MPGDGFALRHAGIDAVLGNDDDIQMGFEPDGTMAGFVNQEADAINKAIDRIGGFWEDQKKLPSTAEGTKILAGITDPWGQQIRYQIKTGISFFVTSDGPDKVWQSEYDIRAEVTVSSQTPSQQRESIANAGSGDLLGFARPETTWLERRKREIAAEEARISSTRRRAMAQTQGQPSTRLRTLVDRSDGTSGVRTNSPAPATSGSSPT